MEGPADDLVAVEIDLQHAGFARDTRSRVPDEVAQRVGDKPAIGELDRLQHVRVVTDDRVGAGIQQRSGEVPLRLVGTGGALDTPVD